MKVQLEKSFAMPGSAETAWALLQDMERVAGCMPGAKITERVDERHYKGTVSVKFGPASMSFRGEVEVKSLEPMSRTLRLLGRGADTTGSSGAAMDLTARVDELDSLSCNLVGTSEVSMSGKAATFGGRMMSTVADQVLNQFAANFAVQVQALQVQALQGQALQGQALQGQQAQQPRGGAGAQPPSTPADARVEAPAAQLNGFGLLRTVVLGWLRNLFGTKKA
jgi:carbon monoxide dehydrogenase subunit G